MTPLTLILKVYLPAPVDMSPLVPERLQGLSHDAIRRLPLRLGTRRVPLGELFEVRGEDAGRLRIARSCDQLEGIGSGMSGGNIEVRGDCGPRLGAGMGGGAIEVRGSAGPWLGAGMRGGRITVRGSVGEFAAGALPGAMEGMQGGLVHVLGDAGARLGERMRRGTVVVHGSAAEHCAARLRAGTLVVLGGCAPRPGIGMRRGTVILAEQATPMSATFNDCGWIELEFLRLLWRSLAGSAPELAPLATATTLARRWCGDMSHGGKGEVLLLSAAERAIGSEP